MAEAIRKAPEDRADFHRTARANLAAWTDCTIPLCAILEHSGMVTRALYCDGGRAILTGSRDGTARFWDAATGRPLRPPIEHGDQVVFVAISPDGRRVATGGSDGKARLWDAATGRPIGQPLFHGEAVNWIAFSPDGRLMASRDVSRGRARLCDAVTGQPLESPGSGGAIRDIQFSPDGRSLVTWEDDVVRSWGAREGRLAGPGVRAASTIMGNFIGPDSRRIVDRAGGPHLPGL